MHGRPRPVKGLPEDPEKTKAASKRVALYSALTEEVLKRKRSKQYDAESLLLSAKLLEQNPEVYTIWNYRREALQDILEGAQGPEAAVEAAATELQISQAALRKNPKSYAAWYHRRWVVQKRILPLDQELALIKMLLQADERNFHGWGYRRFVVGLMGRSPEAEEAYTKDRIDTNFSNYSAWHARTSLLQQIYGSHRTLSLADLMAEKDVSSAPPGAAAVPVWVLRDEFKLVEAAIFTDPEDQSPWMYHRWLMGNALALLEGSRDAPTNAATLQELGQLLEGEVQQCDTLLEVEPDRGKGKWPLLTKARLRELQAQLEAGGPSAEGWLQEARELYRELIDVDPLRRGYYEDCLAGEAHVRLRTPANLSGRPG